MSHNKDEVIICPNCGSEARNNYCSQCGQPNHLHKETFWGMIVHFVAHYFHYESRFWQTIKTLIAKPGELTLAYWDNKRARHIPPISLYIFVSSVYFVVQFFLFHNQIERLQHSEKWPASIDSALAAKQQKMLKQGKAGFYEDGRVIDSGSILEEIEEIVHEIPKVFFFMVPFMAFILKLFFRRREDLFYVDHAVFSLHIHILCFILFLVESLLDHWLHWDILDKIFLLAVLFYITLATRKAYKVSTGRAIALTLTGMVLYGLVLVLIIVGMLWYKMPYIFRE